ncbi:MAG: hypothetical protein AAF203_07535 [Pseudomonadota bacterium]
MDFLKTTRMALIIGICQFLFLSQSLGSSSLQTLMVHGVAMKINVEDKGSYKVYTLAEKTKIPLAGGNSMTLTNAEIDFHPGVFDQKGYRISLITVYEPNTTQWKFPSGETLALSCGQRTAFDRPRLVSFYPNQQLERGCKVGGSGTVIMVDGQVVSVNPQSDAIDFARNGYVQYLRKGSISDFEFLSQTL